MRPPFHLIPPAFAPSRPRDARRQQMHPQDGREPVAADMVAGVGLAVGALVVVLAVIAVAWLASL